MKREGFIHLVGIGGDGMLAIAQYLADQGKRFSGSDLRSSAELSSLAAKGIDVFDEHRAANVSNAELLVLSDAVPLSSPEVIEARIRDVPIMRRAEYIEHLTRDRQRIYVAGSHGKTSTSAMIATVLQHAGRSPGFILGASVPCLGNRRGRASSAGPTVIEACEAFNNLATLQPDHAVLTNVDNDHLEHYGSQEWLDKAFRKFLGRASNVPIVNGDDSGVRRILAHEGLEIVTFGFDASNQVRAANYSTSLGAGASFDLIVSHYSRRIHLQVPGRHSVYNALACSALCLELGLGIDEIARGLAAFSGASRRWQDFGKIGAIRLVDDYAHHPSELLAAAETAKKVSGEGQTVVVAYQPQLVSRTRRLLNETAEALAEFDKVFLLDVDCAGEAQPGINLTDLLARNIRERGRMVSAFTGVGHLVAEARNYLSEGDLLIVAGAGSIRTAAERIKLAWTSDRHSEPPAPSATDLPIGTAPLFHDQQFFTTIGDISRTSVLDKLTCHVQGNPGQLAIASDSVSMTYGEVGWQSDRLATALTGRGIRPGDVIAVCMPSSPELVISAIAVAKIGAVYLPIDPTHPHDRKQYMLDMTECRTLLRKSGSRGGDGLRGLMVLDVELEKSGQDIDDGDDQSLAFDGSEIAYICFTSGSTGKPKGVPISHQALATLVADIVPRFGLGSDMRMALNTSIGFDVSLAEIWGSLCAGGVLCVTESDKPLVGSRLTQFLAEARVSHLTATPTVLRSMPRSELPDLRCVISAGEACPPELVNSWAHNRQFFNAYGPTEATIYSTAALCQPNSEITIGKVLAHLSTFILSEDFRPVQPGDVGELCLSGVGIAQGYLGAPEETEARFRILSLEGVEERVYCTGDLVRQRRDGEIIFIGRRDSQVKLRGNRIELEEIENILLSVPGVREAAACLHEAARDRQIICFVVAANHGAALSEDLLRAELARWLPAGLLPQQIHIVDEIKTTASGKKDRHAQLAAFHSIRSVRPKYEPPRSNAERLVAAIWKKLFIGQEPIGVYDSFDDLGGDSLKMLEMIAEIESRVGFPISPDQLGKISTVANLAVILSEMVWEREAGHEQEGAQGFYASHIYRKLNYLTNTWEGQRSTGQSLIRSLGQEDAPIDFFICVQYEEEMVMLSRHLGEEFRVHGMRSGHLVMSYTPANIESLSSHYCEEIQSLRPRGKILLGGFCQGATIALAIARKLSHPFKPDLLLLIEQARFPSYDGDLAFYYSQDSFLNPTNRFEDGYSRLDEIYGSNYTIDILPGPHGLLHQPPHVQELVARIRKRLLPNHQALARGA